jgi:hypothetical protein
MAATLTVSGQFRAGDTVSLIKRTLATAEAWQLERITDPRAPAGTEQRPPSDFAVFMTAVTDELGVTTFTDVPLDAFREPRRSDFWVIGPDPERPGGWKRLAGTVTAE